MNRAIVVPSVLIVLAGIVSGVQGGVPVLDLCQRYQGDLGVAFPGKADAQGVLVGIVKTPQKFALLGIKDVKLDEPVQFTSQNDGNAKIVVPRLNREHILLSPDNGGWWPMLAEGLGFKLDVLPAIGQPFVAVCGVVVDPKKLIALGLQEVMQGARLELYDYIEEVWRAQPLLAELAGVRGEESKVAAAKGAFLGKITIGAGDVALRGMPDASKEPDKFLAAVKDRGISVVLPKVPDFGDRGPGAVIGIVADLDKLAVLGLFGAKLGDHVHLIPQGQDWRATLCLPRGKTTLVRVNDQGALERVEVKQR